MRRQQFNSFSIDSSSEILELMGPMHFSAEKCRKLGKKTLCEIGCAVACLDPSSALPSRKLRTTAELVRKRSHEIFNDWHTRFEIPEANKAGGVPDYCSSKTDMESSTR